MSLDALNILLKAKSKSVVEQCLSTSFESRFESTFNLCCSRLKSLLELDDDINVEKLLSAIFECIDVALYDNSPEALAAHLELKGGAVDPRLRSLVGQVITSNLHTWIKIAESRRVALPALHDVAWTVQLKKETPHDKPALFTSLTLEIIGQKTVSVDLSPEILATLLEGLGKIKGQLASMT